MFNRFVCSLLAVGLLLLGAGCQYRTLEMELSTRDAAKPVSNAVILVQRVDEEIYNWYTVGSTTTDANGVAYLTAGFGADQDLRVSITVGENRYWTVLTWKDIKVDYKSVIGLQSLRPDVKAPDPAVSPAIDLRYRWLVPQPARASQDTTIAIPD
jgi:hypothetical protein